MSSWLKSRENSSATIRIMCDPIRIQICPWAELPWHVQNCDPIGWPVLETLCEMDPKKLVPSPSILTASVVQQRESPSRWPGSAGGWSSNDWRRRPECTRQVSPPERSRGLDASAAKWRNFLPCCGVYSNSIINLNVISTVHLELILIHTQTDRQTDRQTDNRHANIISIPNCNFRTYRFRTLHYIPREIKVYNRIWWLYRSTLVEII